MFPVTFIHSPARHSSRLGQRLQVALGAAAALTAISLSPGSAQAYVVTVGGAQYDLSTYTFLIRQQAPRTPSQAKLVRMYQS